ncbi:MAG: glycosyltransferase family 10, partial [Candidatus Omnitrophica bacterium]|nr:glycosyltransferase family 10 [Candidatus Omnitrophota bacterium]
PDLYRNFSIVFTWNDKYVDGRKFIKIHWPQTRQFPSVPKIAFRDRKLLVNISMNKFLNHPRELYSARRVSIRYFERNQPDNFDLYGVGWNRPMNLLEKMLPFTRQFYSSYRGTVQNKWDVLPRYRFSLCYENIRDETGWVTEKIFDCMRAGCVPIYWGAPNITEYVDPEAFIDRRKFESDSELEVFLLSITEKEYERFQEAMQDYLRSERFAKFMPPKYADTIIGALGLDKSGGYV